MSSSARAKVLVVGSGGREHALAAALKASPKVAHVAYAGGDNAGLEAFAERIDPGETLARAADFDLVVIGPEAPLCEGLADALRARDIPVFGPTVAAAQLESSKAFTKAICQEAGIPTARFQVAESEAEALDTLDAMGAPIVVKADGLAAGKGVIIAETEAEAKAAIAMCFAGTFGAAGARVVLEEKLEGPEVSLFALCDGKTIRPLASARDYKRAYDGDAGPNTGGMGAVSPAPGVSEETLSVAIATIVRPTIEALQRRGIDYVGVLYAGLMLTREGPKLIEFNVRFGDPECQAIVPRLTTDIYELCEATAKGTLADLPLILSPETSVAVVVAAAGYPGEVTRGERIGGLAAVEAAGATVFHAGTKRADDAVLSNGGRVLAAVATGSDVASARARVYGALEHLDWPGGRMRTDIAG